MKSLQIINRYDKELEKSGVLNCRRNVEIMLSKILNCKRADLYLNESPLSKGQLGLFQDYISLRKKRLPIEYILEETEFFGLKLRIWPGVFIPRPETESLVEAAIEIASGIEPKNKTLSICEIGCGSGNVAISLARHIENCRIFATDISEVALNLSRQNAKKHKMEEKTVFIGSNLFSAFKRKEFFDIILSSLPYIAEEDFKDLSKEVLYEPRQAIWGGRGGLELFRKFISQANNHLVTGGYVILEIGTGQSDAIKKLLQENNFKDIKIIKDYSNTERIISARWKR